MSLPGHAGQGLLLCRAGLQHPHSWQGRCLLLPQSPGAAEPGRLALLLQEWAQSRAKLCPRAAGSDQPSLAPRGMSPRGAGRGDPAPVSLLASIPSRGSVPSQGCIWYPLRGAHPPLQESCTSSQHHSWESCLWEQEQQHF